MHTCTISRIISKHALGVCPVLVRAPRRSAKRVSLCSWLSFVWWLLVVICALRRSSRSLVYVMMPSSVPRLTTFSSTESYSKCTPSNCSPPTASSTTSVSFSPLQAELSGIPHKNSLFTHIMAEKSNFRPCFLKFPLTFVEFYDLSSWSVLQSFKLLQLICVSFHFINAAFVSHLQTCFQRTAWKRKQSRSTPMLSWQRLNMTTDKGFSSSKTK